MNYILRKLNGDLYQHDQVVTVPDMKSRGCVLTGQELFLGTP